MQDLSNLVHILSYLVVRLFRKHLFSLWLINNLNNCDIDVVTRASRERIPAEHVTR